MMTNPCRRLFQSPREMRERGWGSHEESQDIHAAGICQEFDFFKGINGLYFFHFN